MVPTTEIVLIGGGHCHVYLLKEFGNSREILRIRQERNLRITLITNTLETPYSGMLPGFVAGHYSYDEIHLNLGSICEASEIRLVHATAQTIEYQQAPSQQWQQHPNGGQRGWILCQKHDNTPQFKIHFDILSIDVGSAPARKKQQEQHHPHVIPVKPIAQFCQYYQELMERKQTQTKTNNRTSLTKHRIAVVGGGAGGVELALSIQQNWNQRLKRLQSQKQTTFRHNPGNGSFKESESNWEIDLFLVTRGSAVLEQHNQRVQHSMERILAQRQIQVHLHSTVCDVEDHGNQSFLKVKNSTTGSTNRIPFDDCIWCTHAQGASWLSQQTPFHCDEKGFIKIDVTYQVQGFPGVFAAGDCAHMVEHPRPKAGVFAVRAGPPLLDNIVATILGKPLKEHIPQSNFLSIISTGNKYAIASKSWWLFLQGWLIWKWKDWIDRSWMAQYKIRDKMKKF